MLRRLAVACTAVYAAAVLLDFHALITSVYLSSDAALAPVLGQAIGHIPAGSYVSLGNHAWYEEWLFLLLTRDLPSHLGLWELAPMAWSIIGLGVLLWTVRQALDARAAVLCGAALVCVGAFGRFCFLAINWHSLSVVHTVVLAGVLVWLVPRLGEISWPGLAALAVAVGLLNAPPTASDSLFPFWALIPLLAAAGAVALRAPPRERRRMAVFIVVTLAVAIAGAVALASVMRHAGITSRALPIGVVAVKEVGHNLVLLAEGYAFLAGGRLTAPSLRVQGLLVPVSALLALAALLLVLEQAGRLLARRSERARMPPQRLAYVAFFSTSLLATLLAFLLTDAPKDALSGRYLLGAYVATAALLPLVAARGPRALVLVTAGVCLFAAIGAYQLIRQPFVVIKSPDIAVRFPGPGTAAALVSFARQEGASKGYGGYWDAEQLTWGTRFKVLIRPVRVCTSRSHVLCYPQLGMVSSWYAPSRRTRSLLVVDSPGTSYNGVLAPDPGLGRPLTARRLGYITVYVYPYDLASRIRRPRCGFTWAHPC